MRSKMCNLTLFKAFSLQIILSLFNSPQSCSVKADWVDPDTGMDERTTSALSSGDDRKYEIVSFTS